MRGWKVAWPAARLPGSDNCYFRLPCRQRKNIRNFGRRSTSAAALTEINAEQKQRPAYHLHRRHRFAE